MPPVGAGGPCDSASGWQGVQAQLVMKSANSNGMRYTSQVIVASQESYHLVYHELPACPR